MSFFVLKETSDPPSLESFHSPSKPLTSVYTDVYSQQSPSLFCAPFSLLDFEQLEGKQQTKLYLLRSLLKALYVL